VRRQNEARGAGSGARHRYYIEQVAKARHAQNEMREERGRRAAKFMRTEAAMHGVGERRVVMRQMYRRASNVSVIIRVVAAAMRRRQYGRRSATMFMAPPGVCRSQPAACVAAAKA